MPLPTDIKAGDKFKDNEQHFWVVVGHWDDPTVVMKRLTVGADHLINEIIQGGIRNSQWGGFVRVEKNS